MSKFSTLVARAARPGGLRWLAGATLDRIFPARPALRSAALDAVQGAAGLEIGGPSRVFSPNGMLPAYRRAWRIDNVNFAPDTPWEGALQDGGAFHFSTARAPGTQWIREAGTLTGITDGAYAFVLSSHCLEHVANPLQALQEWRRVTSRNGHLILVLPDPRKTFDHRRPFTTFEHLENDRDRKQLEDDPTHFPEVLALHDLTRDAHAGSPAEFQARLENNFKNRCLHHHVFDLMLIHAALEATGWTVVATERARPLHLVALARNETA